MMIYIDLDNTVFDTIRTIVTMYNADYKYAKGYKYIVPDYVKSYEFVELECATLPDIIKYFDTYRFFTLVQCLPGFVSEIRDLYFNYGCEITFISRGTSMNLQGKSDWVDEFEMAYKIPCHFIGVDVSNENKSSVDMYMSILIDDEVQNLNTSTASYNICFGDYEWNKHYDGIKCTNWNQVGYTIREILKGGRINDY